VATNLTIIEKNGLLAELAYLKLESNFFKEKYGNNYSKENIINYLNATYEKIKQIIIQFYISIYTVLNLLLKIKTITKYI